jgi:uncharacterized membrane protein YfcA
MWEDLILFAAVGFVAQLVDGAIGMAYGVTATTVLLGSGVSPAMASASVHVAKIFTGAASGLAHWRVGNVDFRIVGKLAIPGMIGGAAGAYLLTEISGYLIRPVISVYLFIVAALILVKALRRTPPKPTPLRFAAPLGLLGGFLDAIGGGGWGPIVASTLIGRGETPRMVIGSVNLTEFFVTVVISAAFVLTIGLQLWWIIGGLVLGGVIAAPFAAIATRHVPDKVLMIGIGVVVMLLSLRDLVRIATWWAD